MELHHKLRRDPSWHPNACNICGQLGHQAANCTNGTINWRQIYGDEAFVLKDPLYWSDIQARLKARRVDVEDLEKRAREYAKMRSQSLGIDYNDMTKKAQAMLDDGKPDGQAGAATTTTAAAAPPAQASKAEEEPLPAGWATAQDAQGRTYFWHKKTQKVQWERPAADTPIN